MLLSFFSSPSRPLDFSSRGTTEPSGAAFRAHVQRYGARPHIYGPSRKDKEAAREDLESMRAAASGMSRDDGFAAMKAEADKLKAGKPPRETGFIYRDGSCYRRPSVVGGTVALPFRD